MAKLGIAIMGPIIISVLVTVGNQFIPIRKVGGGAEMMGSEETS
jgi:hypothetical protein